MCVRAFAQDFCLVHAINNHQREAVIQPKVRAHKRRPKCHACLTHVFYLDPCCMLQDMYQAAIELVTRAYDEGLPPESFLHKGRLTYASATGHFSKEVRAHVAHHT